MAKFNGKKEYLKNVFVLLSYDSLNDTRFSDNRFCTWPAGIALPSGGDAS